MATTTVRTGQPSGDTPIGMGDAQIRAVLSGLMLGLLLAALDQTIVSTALPTIVGELGGLNHLSWVVTAYLVTSTASTPLWGKISDLYGRKLMYIIAIVVFLVASALAGLSQSMWQLIATRGLQGIGGGGLLALTFAIVGDVIPPRDRGKYQGYFGAVFGLSSIAGPLLGGFFVDRLSWRWIFYINLPIGAIALFVISGVLHLRHQRRERAIDYLGSALLVAAVISGLLALVRGNEIGWTSGEILGLATAAVVLTVVFVWWEGRAPEPILPLRLFRNTTFSLVTVIGFMIGFALFGAIVFLPVYLQVVQRASPTRSGLMMIPMMAGVIAASVFAGRMVTRTGRYKIFPIVGTLVAAVGMALLTLLGSHTPLWQAGTYMAVLGIGVGLCMQVLVIITQNSVAMSDMGVATSSTQFFRSLGGTFGTAIFGAVLSSRLSHYLAESLPGGLASAGGDSTSLLSSPAQINKLPPAIHDRLVDSFVRALGDVFLTAVPVLLVGFVLACFVHETRLKTAADRTPVIAGQAK
jgi:EmrB/QacA subfamily drug resistance transporter